MVFPNPRQIKLRSKKKEQIVFSECYCPNGHQLISSKAKFNKLNGILLKISKEEKEGYIALSPIYGNKIRVGVLIDLIEGECYKLSCPECNVELPIFTNCHCGGEIFSLFLSKKASFDSFIGACNRIGCENSYVQNGDDLFTVERLKAVKK